MCTSLYIGPIFAPNGIIGGEVGPNVTYPAESGRQYFVTAGGGCLNISDGTNTLQTSSWHTGQPLSAPAPVEPITVGDGPTPVTITVGAGQLSGTVSVPAPAAPSSCRVSIIGNSSISGDLVAETAPIEADGSWARWVPAGDYTVETSCFARSAFEVWPNKATIADGTRISVSNGEMKTGINFDMSDRWNESTGAPQIIQFASSDDRNTPKCVEAYAANGDLVRRSVGNGVGIADNGEYRVRVADCFGYGFGVQWFPAGATRNSGPTITIDGSVFEFYHPAAPLG